MKIGVIIVTRNRLDCLARTLQLYEIQTKKPQYIVVVDNCSTDGKTGKYLDEWEKADSMYKRVVIHAKTNNGGSGGFFIAEEMALKLDADWVWHADDDAYPDVDSLKNIEEAYRYDNSNVVAYCASVRNVENQDEDISYWRRLYKGIVAIKWIPVKNTDVYFDVDKFTYLGCVIKKDILKRVGLTNKDFFIHEDDIEHSMRIRKEGRIVAVRNAIIYHPAWKDVIDPKDINWKYYYSVRNKIISIGMNLGKRYAFGEVIKALIRYYMHIAKGYPNKVLMMEKEAIIDGMNRRIGKNEKYMPS